MKLTLSPEYDINCFGFILSERNVSDHFVSSVVDQRFMETYEKQQCIYNFHVMETMCFEYDEA